MVNLEGFPVEQGSFDSVAAAASLCRRSAQEDNVNYLRTASQQRELLAGEDSPNYLRGGRVIRVM